MKKTMDLLNEVVAMGFAKEEALNQIDASLDEFIRLERKGRKSARASCCRRRRE